MYPITHKKSEKPEVTIITPEDLKLIFDDLQKTNVEHFTIAKIKYLAALRASELITLTGKSFDLRKRLVFINNAKGKRFDTISMPNDLYEFLLTLEPGGNNLFFPNLTYDVIKSFWARSMHRLNLKYNIHLLRKTRGSQLAEKGVSPFTLKSFMRHTSIRTTEQFYIHTNINKATQEIDSKLNSL
jgi:integrase